MRYLEVIFLLEIIVKIEVHKAELYSQMQLYIEMHVCCFLCVCVWVWKWFSMWLKCANRGRMLVFIEWKFQKWVRWIKLRNESLKRSKVKEIISLGVTLIEMVVMILFGHIIMLFRTNSTAIWMQSLCWLVMLS